MEPANPMNCMQMDDDDDDGDDQISLNDLRLMYAKLLEIHRKDIATEGDLRERIKELKASSIEKKAEKMRNQVREIKDKIEATKEENKILCTFSILFTYGFAENQEKVKNLLSEPIDIINNDVTRLSEKATIFSDFVLNSKISSACQTDLTFPPSFSCFFSTSSQEDKPFNAQDAFIEIQLAHKRQLEERLNYLKKQMWFDGPDVMLVKFDDYEKMIAKSSSRRRRRLKRNQNQFDCYLDIERKNAWNEYEQEKDEENYCNGNNKKSVNLAAKPTFTMKDGYREMHIMQSEIKAISEWRHKFKNGELNINNSLALASVLSVANLLKSNDKNNVTLIEID